MFAGGRALGRRDAVLCIALVALALVYLFARSFQDRHALRDWVTVYAGGVCLVEGCSPYDTASLDRVLQQRGEPVLHDWYAQLPIYPPTTMALFAPLAPLNVVQATNVMYWGSILVALLCGYACFVRGSMLANLSPVIRSLLFALMLGSPKMTWEFSYGNPVVLAVPLLLFCCLDVAPNRRWLRVVLFALACLLKPQIALPLLLPMLLKRQDGWKSVAAIAALLGVYTAAVLAWCARHPATAHWRAGLAAMLAQGAAPGSSMDPSDRTQLLNHLLDMQYAVGYWIDVPAVRAHVSTVLLAVLSLIFVAAAFYAAVKRPGTWVYLVIVAATSSFTLLLVYHRFYDSMLLILALPCAAVALHARQHLVVAGAILLDYALEFRQWLNTAHGLLQVHGVPHARSFSDFLVHRMNALALILLTLVLAAELFRTAYRAPERAVAA